MPTPVQVPLAVNGKWLVRPLTGTGRYSTEAVKELLRLEPETTVVLPSDATVPEWLPPARVERSALSGQLFEQVALPWLTRNRVLLNLSGPAPLLARRQVVVMHDATPFRFPDAFSRRFALWYRAMYRWLGRRRTRLVTVSRFSAKELAECLRVRLERFTVAAPAASVHDVTPRRPEADLPERFFLFVGTLARNKNLAPAIRALTAAGYPAVVVGARGASTVFSAEGNSLEDDGAVLLGRIADEELAWLYRNAVALVFPSLYEGFGLPLLEAQSQGCPTLTSDRSAMPEVCAESALYFDPDDMSSLVDRAAVVWNDSELRERLIESGTKNAERFSWADTARSIVGASRA